MSITRELLLTIIMFGGVPVSIYYGFFVIKMSRAMPTIYFDMGPYGGRLDFKNEIDSVPTLVVMSLIPIFGTWMACTVFVMCITAMLFGERREKYNEHH